MANSTRKPAGEETVEDIFFAIPKGMEKEGVEVPEVRAPETVESVFFDDPAGYKVVQENTIEFPFSELVAREAAALAEGYTAGASAPVVSGATAAAKTTYERLLSEKKYDEAKDFLTQLQEEFVNQQKRQSAFRTQYPFLTGVGQFAGAVIPTSIPSKLTGFTAKQLAAYGGKEAPLLMKAGASGIAGAAEGAIYGASTADKPEDAPLSGAVGGTVGATVGAGFPIVGAGMKAGANIAGALASSAVSRLAKTDQGSWLIEKVFGVARPLQKKYVENHASIDAAPTREEMAKAFQEIQDNLEFEKVDLERIIAATEAQIKSLDRQIADDTARFESEEKQKLAKQTQLLKFAVEKLKDLSETQKIKVAGVEAVQEAELSGAKVAAKEAKDAANVELEEAKFAQDESFRAAKESGQRRARMATEEYREQSAIPRVEPEVQVIEDALENLMTNVMAKSVEAQAYLTPNVSIPRSVILSALVEQRDQMVIPGTKVSMGPMDDARRELETLIKKITDEKEGLPEEVSGANAKAFLKMISARMDELKKQGKGSEIPYAYAHPSFSTLYQSYVAISEALKEASDPYKKKMLEVAPLRKLYSDLTQRNFKTPSQIRASLNRSTVDPEIQGQLQQLKDSTGIDVTDYQARRARAEELKKYGPRQEAIELLPAVQALNLLNERIRRETSPAARRQLERSLPLYQKAVEEEAKVEAIRRSNRAIIEASPEYQQLEQTKKLIQLAEANDFNRSVFDEIKDTEEAQKIIGIKQALEALNDPIQIAEALAQRTGVAESSRHGAIKTLAAKQELYDKVRNYADQIAIGTGDFPGKNLIDRILADPHNENMTPAMLRMLQAIDQMSPETYKKYVKTIAILQPGQFEEMMKALRVRTAMDTPLDAKTREKIWRGVGAFAGLWAADFWSEFFDGMGFDEKLGESMKEGVSPLQRASMFLPYAIGAFGGGYLGNYINKNGGAITRAMLRKAYNLKGLPTAKKAEKISPVKLSPALRSSVAFGLITLTDSYADNERVNVNAANIPFIEMDIHASSMRMADKVKALNELRTRGTISGRTMKQVMLEGAELSMGDIEAEDTRLNVPQEPQPEEMLSRMAKRKKAT